MNNQVPQEREQGSQSIDCEQASAYAKTELSQDIEEEEVSITLRQLSVGKAAGNDGVIMEMLRYPRCFPFNSSLLMKCFELRLTPTQWRIGTIVPIPKACTKDPLDPSQYKGITALSVVYKPLCKILGNRLVGVIEGEKLLSDEQIGFRSNRGCIDHVLALSLLGEKRLKEKKDTFLCFIDLKKAYDSVDRNLLWKQLELRGIKCSFLGMLKEIYRDIQCQVRVGEGSSGSCSVGRGLRP